MNYIKRHSFGIIKKENNETIVMNTGLKTILNTMCLRHGSTVQGRIKSAQYLLHITQVPPIFVNKDCVLICSKSLRHPDTVCINSVKIQAIRPNLKGCVIVLDDEEKIQVNTTDRTMKRRLKYAKRIKKVLA